MIRSITSDDRENLIALAETTGLFGSSEMEELREVLKDYFGSNIDRDHFWITDDDDGLVGVAYYAPAPMTDGTWYLYLIAVRPEYQGQGRGTALLHYVEQALAARNERVLLVETSGLPSFEGTRAFYRKCGYNEEARIRDYYKAGEDKIIYRKVLSNSEAE